MLSNLERFDAHYAVVVGVQDKELSVSPAFGALKRRATFGTVSYYVYVQVLFCFSSFSLSIESILRYM